MAGSFGVFRQYEKAALAALAIMAMLAFFVLPPILQMGGGGSGGPDPMVVSWTGGGLRESGVQRAVIMRKVMNQFLVATMAASGQDPSRMRLADDEKDVVDTLLLAREAEANGIVISNSAINQFLAEWTNDLVPPKDFDAIVAGIGGRMGISQEDVFEALRTVLMARRMETLLLGGVGFEAAPPGVRWDYYRRLEQGAAIEAVPVVVEKFVDQLPEPAEPVLRAFFDAHRDDDISQLGWVDADYAWVTRQLADLSDELCEGRIVSMLEGGYNLPALGRCVEAHVRGLLDLD